tara:strand:- start:711 stop:1589 length:879 start_codon:yes stop_codon:yes gene_type:complete
MKELKDTVKIGEGDEAKEVEIIVRQPPNSAVKLADAHKNKVWGQAIQDGVLTKKELGVLMRKRGIWDEKKDKEEDSITRDIVRLEKELYHGKPGHRKPKVSEGRDLAIQIRKKRIELRDLITEKLTLEENTAENLADNARFDYLVATCTYYANGDLVYKSFEEYNSKSADEIAYAAGALLGKMMYNIDSSFEKNLPENKFLSNFNLINDDLSLIDPNDPDKLIDTEGRRIDEKGYYVDEDGNRTDKDGNPLTEAGLYEISDDYENDLVVKPKPKRTRKKTTAKKTEEIATES